MTILKKLLNSLCFTRILEPQGPEPFVELLGLGRLGGPFSFVKHSDLCNSPEASTEALRRPKCARVGGTPKSGGGEEGEGGSTQSTSKFARWSKTPCYLAP